ncbi:SnoaL-like polyketide cyclase [Colletotrichum godetiae]|uniref:SnoaL-like polyketide cyclase n=1 Tax=Colletotrichum godetiae TaxID=1209918 RepID=A0AAJ0AUX7_9PEZI|nr:SnoaL-like polyketide cyclase [Colletotrichum godetiae]KAK1689446.1 SnoaL-like polyketide cyclase [Colletotrichum godetiae]
MSRSKKKTEETFRKIINNCNAGNEAGLEFLLHMRCVRFNGEDCLTGDFAHRLNRPLGTNSTNVVKIDTILVGGFSSNLAARLINRTTLRDSGTVFEYAEIVFAEFMNDSLFGWRSLRDEVAVFSREFSAVPTTPSPAPASQPSSETSVQDMKAFYQRYIKCINDRTMSRNFTQFCQPELIHNDRKFSIAEYIPLISESQDAIDDLYFEIDEMVAEEEMQQIAARLKFTGTPIKEWGGVKPNGNEVEFHEHVIYQLVDGKISRVSSVIELDVYRQQMM